MTIKFAAREEIPALWDIANAVRAEKEYDYFDRQIDLQDIGSRQMLILQWKGQFCGYCVFNRQPKYAFFKKLGIPEIQDLVVMSEFRRRGIATAAIAWCETLAHAEGFLYMGIGVGLHGGFGAAQKLYVSLGYVPDGYGVTYDRSPVVSGEIRAIDDHLSLMMIKSLS